MKQYLSAIVLGLSLAVSSLIVVARSVEFWGVWPAILVIGGNALLLIVCILASRQLMKYRAYLIVLALGFVVASTVVPKTMKRHGFDDETAKSLRELDKASEDVKDPNELVGKTFPQHK